MWVFKILLHINEFLMLRMRKSWRVLPGKMKVYTPEVVWHEKQPILSVDFHPCGRLASGGADNFVRVSGVVDRTVI